MKKITKVLTVVLAILMIMMTSVTAFADHAMASLEEVIEINQEAGGSNTYLFEAPEEGWYIVTTYTEDDWTDPCVAVYDEYNDEIAYCDDSFTGIYNGEAWFYAYEDEPYYITFSNFNSETVTYTAWLEAENENSHVYCVNDCFDEYCDVCGSELYVYNELPLDEYAVLFQAPGEEEAFDLTAPEEGWYVITTYSYDEETDPYVYVTDSYGYVIGACDDSAYCSFDGEAWFYAYEGETYTISIGNYNDYYDVNFDVYFEKANEYSHIYCSDEDGDGYCDFCEIQICDHRCHDNGFFWRIANLFNRIFRINERCECGVYHW